MYLSYDTTETYIERKDHKISMLHTKEVFPIIQQHTTIHVTFFTGLGIGEPLIHTSSAKLFKSTAVKFAAKMFILPTLYLRSSRRELRLSLNLDYSTGENRLTITQHDFCSQLIF